MAFLRLPKSLSASHIGRATIGGYENPTAAPRGCISLRTGISGIGIPGSLTDTDTFSPTQTHMLTGRSSRSEYPSRLGRCQRIIPTNLSRSAPPRGSICVTTARKWLFKMSAGLFTLGFEDGVA